MLDPTPPISAFVSYSHDSDAHKLRVADLATRLRSEGVDCELDQWIGSPAEGWPKWMIKHITNAKFVIVVCTEAYYRRVTGLDETGGLGSRWEGALITQELYETGGSNTKFVPVIFDPADERWRPPFLRGATYYDVSTDTGYDQLYRHLTEQPAVVKPPLGNLRRLAPVERPAMVEPSVAVNSDRRLIASLVLLFPVDGDFAPVTTPMSRAELGDQLSLELVPEDAKTSAILSGLRSRKGSRIGVAYALTPIYGRLQEAKQSFVNGEERWILTITPSTEHIQALFAEMSFGDRSADEIAALRARRILLNDQLPKTAAGGVDQLNAVTLDVFVSGLNTPIAVSQSPFPAVYKTLGDDKEYFLAVCRLFGILYLYLSATVERVHELELALHGTVLSVKFEGQRPRKFSNVQPVILRVAGECQLREPEA
jgi:hypothetical protein